MSSRVEILSRSEPDPWSRRAASDYFRDYTAGMSHEERLAQVRWLARLMDDNFRIPGTPLRFGWDSVIGLFPGLGDVLTSAISLLIVHHAWHAGASKLTLLRMLGNVGVDFVVGRHPACRRHVRFCMEGKSQERAIVGAPSHPSGREEAALRPQLRRNLRRD